ncbi:MAG: EAL domain-containing protein [Rhodocyclales bacterium]|nr:EAL domain-containing protein [Rhodocyclales bacterium]
MMTRGTAADTSLKTLIKRLPIALVRLNAAGKVLEANDKLLQILGYSREEVPTIDAWWPLAYPDPVYRQEVMTGWEAAVGESVRTGAAIGPLQYRITCKNGEERLVEVSGATLGDEIVATFNDITERERAEETRRRLNRELRAISDCNQALLRAEDEQVLLDQVCRIICDEAGYRVAFVAYAEHDADQTVRPVAWAGMDAGYFAGAKLTWADRDLGRGPLGTAIRTGQVVEIPDIANDPRMAPWRQRALARGYRSGVAFPLKGDQQEVFGGLLIYSGEANAITAEEIRLLDELAGDLAFGISTLRIRAERQRAEAQIVASEQLFRTMVENSPDFIARYDRDLRRLYVNPSLEKLFGSPASELLGKPAATASPLRDPEHYLDCLRRVVATGTECSDEIAGQYPNGDAMWINVRFAPEFDADGKVATVLAISNDITARRQSEDSLRLAASVFATSQEGILISDPDNRIIDVNPAFTRLTGYTREEALGRDPSFLASGRHNADFYAEMWRSIEIRGAWQGEIWNRRKSGEAFAELLTVIAVKDGQGNLQHYVGAFSDISILKEHEADLDRIAHYDVLTSVPNRRLLGDRLEQAIARARRLGKNLAVCYLDLDGFKPINDQFGHEGGDRLLVEIAHRLQTISRGDDTVARLGGDEFVLLWNDIGHESECFQALDRILAEVSSPMILNGVPVSVSASIGVTMFPDDDVDADSLLRHADHAMYSAKQLGKNRYQLFDSRLERQISSRVEFLAKVANGLDSDQFELHYQPKVDCVAGRLIGVEALIRWHDPILGLVGPKEFLPLIENDNLTFRMGRWVMAQAVRQAKRWHDAGLDVPISINLFPRHLKFPTFIDDLRNAIASEWPGLPANRLLLEIVETSDLEELDPIEAVINECLAMGIGFSLDDFGTGYSSLVYLRRLSVEELKIDQSFVRDMMTDPDDQAIVAGVIALGTAFNLRVVAEGVESPEQARHLVGMGCTTVQGYGFGSPMPARDIPEWLSRFLSQGVTI